MAFSSDAALSAFAAICGVGLLTVGFQHVAKSEIGISRQSRFDCSRRHMHRIGACHVTVQCWQDEDREGKGRRRPKTQGPQRQDQAPPQRIDFSNFLQVMRKNGSELGDGTLALTP